MKSHAIKKLDYDLILLNLENNIRGHMASFDDIEDARSLIHIQKRLCKSWVKFEIYFNDKLIETL